jgi:signal transduction histidine kinase
LGSIVRAVFHCLRSLMKIRWRIFNSYLGVVIIPVVALSWLFFVQSKKVLEKEQYVKLEGIAELKVKKVESIFDELTQDMTMAQSLYNIKLNLPILAQLINDKNDPVYLRSKKMLDAQLKAMLAFKDIAAIELVDPEGMVVYGIYEKQNEGELGNSISGFSKNLLKQWQKGIWISNVFDHAAHMAMAIVAPVLGLDNKHIGFIVFHVDMDPIFELIQDTTGLGQTGETLIVQKIGQEVIFLNPLRYDKNAALKRKVALNDKIALPAIAAAQGFNGSGITRDYRNKEVISAWRYIPSRNWGLVAKIDASEAFASTERVKKTMLLFAFTIMLLAGMVAFWIAKSISDPIHALHEGTEVIGRGNLDFRVGIKTRDEIGQLSRSFDEMADNLKDVLASRNALDMEVMERKKTEEILKKMDQKKSDFVANVAHEFKNPLAVVNESLSIVLEGVVGEVNLKQKEMLEIGSKTINRLSRLVNDLLDVAKIEAGKMELKIENIEIAAVVDEVIEANKIDIAKHKLDFKKEIMPEAGFLWADKDKLTEVILNLLSNAIKYTPPGGSISVKVEGFSDEVRFDISDSGQGIAKEDISRLFDKFERVTAEKQEGTGLGLCIAKDIVELHKGKILVESQIGKGSKFSFVLPRDPRKIN